MLLAFVAHARRRCSGFRRHSEILGFAAAGLLVALALAPTAVASGPAQLTFRLVRVGSPGNQAASVVPFADAIYPSCSVAPKTKAGCLSVGSVASPYDIGELEVTVAQWVAFLNTVDPKGTDPHHLYDSSESASPRDQCAFPSHSKMVVNSLHNVNVATSAANAKAPKRQ